VAKGGAGRGRRGEVAADYVTRPMQ
jgi:hypothetical protein